MSSADVNNLNATTTARAIAAHLGLALDGPDGDVASFSPFPARCPHAVCFLQGDVPPDASAAPGFALTIALPGSAAALRRLGYSVIASAQPKFDISVALDGLHLLERVAPSVHPTAILSGAVVVSETATIGAYTVIDGRVRIGDHAVIGPHVRVFSSVRIGASARVHSGSVIGVEAFTLGVSADGRTMPLPSFGGVELGERVEIGHNVTIARAVDGDTVIAARARISDLVMVGNAVTIGEDSVVMPSCNVGGRVVVGARCWIGMGACIRESVRIGDGAKVGMGAVVLRDVAPGEVVAGVPARPIRGQH